MSVSNSFIMLIYNNGSKIFDEKINLEYNKKYNEILKEKN